MQLYFIRHAQSENNWLFARTGSFDGRHEDPGITHLGQQQARVVGRRACRHQLGWPWDEDSKPVRYQKCGDYHDDVE